MNPLELVTICSLLVSFRVLEIFVRTMNFISTDLVRWTCYGRLIAKGLTEFCGAVALKGRLRRTVLRTLCAVRGSVIVRCGFFSGSSPTKRRLPPWWFGLVVFFLIRVGFRQSFVGCRWTVGYLTGACCCRRWCRRLASAGCRQVRYGCCRSTALRCSTARILLYPSTARTQQQPAHRDQTWPPHTH